MPDSVIAVFSDIHANLEALQAVFADMNAHNPALRVCLGDIVGYAANPAQCLNAIRKSGCSVIMGNHDEAAATDIDLGQMRDIAQHGIEFTRRKLTTDQRDYLAHLAFTLSHGDCQFVHASLNAPSDWHYLMRESELAEHFASQTHPFCFSGHTHVPGVWHLNRSGNIKSWRGAGRIEIPFGGKTLINVGSVGQPRDLCPDACYALCNPVGRWVEFRRVKYDIARARRKITRAGLPSYAGQRLSLGR